MTQDEKASELTCSSSEELRSRGRPRIWGMGIQNFQRPKKIVFDSVIYKFRAHNSLLIYHKQNKIKATTIHRC
jgi:hypothetical protein